MDDRETLNRRARLRELITVCFDGKDSKLLDYVEHRYGKRPNQGEISGLQKDNGSRSFGDKKAKTLTEQIGLHRRWFDMTTGAHLQRSDWLRDEQPPAPGQKTDSQHLDQEERVWPFPSIKPERVTSLPLVEQAEIEADLRHSLERVERRLLRTRRRTVSPLVETRDLAGLPPQSTKKKEST